MAIKRIKITEGGPDAQNLAIEVQNFTFPDEENIFGRFVLIVAEECVISITKNEDAELEIVIE